MDISYIFENRDKPLEELIPFLPFELVYKNQKIIITVFNNNEIQINCTKLGLISITEKYIENYQYKFWTKYPPDILECILWKNQKYLYNIWINKFKEYEWWFV